MLRIAKYLLVFFACIRFSDAFTMRSRWGSASMSPSSTFSPRQPASLALYAQRTNYTTLVKDYEIEDSTRFLEAMNEQYSGFEGLNDRASVCEIFAEEVEDEQEGLSDVWRARLLLVGAAALYGTNFSLVKLLGDTMPVGVSSTLRFGLAVLVTLPWLVKDINKDGALMAAWLGFEIGLWNSIGYVAQAVGLETTPASESAFICSLAVVTVPLLDFVAGKRLLPRQWIGAVLAVVGVAFLELGGDMSASSMTVGDMLSLVQPFAFGIGFWRMEQAMQRFPEEAPRLTAAQILAVFFASAGYGLWAIDLPTLQSYPWAEWLTSTPVLLGLFWTGCISTALTIYMENLALRNLSAAETTLIFSTEPIWGTAFAAAVMGEQLGFNAAVGAFCILTACVYSNLGWQGINSLLKGMAVKDTRKPISVSDLPAAFQKQWAWFSSSAATSWASWSVAAKIPLIEETIEESITNILEKLP